MSDIPSELFREILCRLPAEPLFRFRSVCKTWRRIIDDPAFIKSHLSRHRFFSNLDTTTQLFLRSGESSKLYSLPLDCIIYVPQKTTITAINRPQLVLAGVPRLWCLPVPSCDGLILLYHFQEDKAWTLWNPFNGEFPKLPPYNVVKDPAVENISPLSGFGYDCVTDDYKVVRIGELHESHELVTLVYSLKLGYWRRIIDGVVPNCYIPGHYNQTAGHGVFAYGALHWLIFVRRIQKLDPLIISLDLGTEVYSMLALPVAILEEEKLLLSERKSFKKSLHVLSGCLILCFYSWVDRLDGWKIEDYGGQKIWTKLFSCAESEHIHARIVDVRPIAYLISKEQILLQHNGGEFFWFDIRENSVIKFSVDGLEGDFSCQVYQPSLLHVYNITDAVNRRAAAKGIG